MHYLLHPQCFQCVSQDFLGGRIEIQSKFGVVVNRQGIAALDKVQIVVLIQNGKGKRSFQYFGHFAQAVK